MRGRPAVSGTLLFAAGVVMVYALVLLAPLLRAHLDASVFVLAGDLFVDAGALPAPIIVRPHDPGFDGQFYYRIALGPLALAPTAHGITLDAPSLRLMRVFYPLLVWLVSLGQPSWTAPAMVGVNLIGLALIAVAICDLSRRLCLPGWCRFAVMLWPGFVITLLRDTTEIWSALLIVLSARAVLLRHPWALAGAGAAACLTRETGVLAVLGLFCLALGGVRRGTPRAGALALAAAVAALPAIAWQVVLRHAFGQTATSSETAANLGPPFEGMVTALSNALHGRPAYHGMGHLLGPTMHLIVAGTIAGLALFTLVVAVRARAAIGTVSLRPLAAAWLPLALMTMVMTGPWIEPLSYFRAFTESFVLGVVLLGATKPPRRVVAIAVGLEFACWGLCVVTLH